MKTALEAVRRFFLSMRLEECMTLLLFIPIAIALAGVANNPVVAPIHPLAVNYPTSFQRLITLVASVIIFLWVARTKPHWGLIRDSLPFLFCANIYANLHDLIRFYGFSDITMILYRWDVLLFGVEPTVWAERFAHPLLTDFLTLSYWTFYVLPPLLGLFLYLKGDRAAFRVTLVSVLLCLYMGYVGYVLWPASAPRLAIPEAYSVTLRGESAALDYTRVATAAIPLTAKGAFPSLHCAVALLAILLSWRHLRWMFPIQVLFGAGLVFGTIYLRHHWVVDILAGFGLTFLALWAGPRLERWWERATARAEARRAAEIVRGGSPSGTPSFIES